MRTHSGRNLYKCSHYDKAFSDITNLECHLRRHCGDRPYQWNQCDNAFSHTIQLVAHIRSHTGEKTYQCKQYDKDFSKGSNNVQLISYLCSIFSKYSTLKCHMRIHTGKRLYISASRVSQTITLLNARWWFTMWRDLINAELDVIFSKKVILKKKSKKKKTHKD